MKCFSLFLKNKWGQVIAWQLCSISMAMEATIVHIISHYYKRTIPLLALSVVYSIILLASCWKVPKSDTPRWRYFVVSITCLAADFLSVTANNETSIGSATVLVNTIIFWVAPLSYFMFKRKLTVIQILSILLSVAGSSMIIVADGIKGSKWLGNVIALCSAFSYAVTNVFQEWTIHDDSLHVYWFRFSAGASPIAIILSGCFEWKEIIEYDWCWHSILLYIGYACLVLLYNYFTPVILQYSDATQMNISLLTSNFFSLGISILFFNQKANWLYLIGFFCIPIAILLFCLFEKKENIENETTFATTSLISENTYSSLTQEQNV